MGDVVETIELKSVRMPKTLHEKWIAADPKRTWPRRIARAGALVLNQGDRLKKLQRGLIDATLIASVAETAALIVRLIDAREATLGGVRLAMQQLLANVEEFHSAEFAAKLDEIERLESCDPRDLPAA